MPKNRDIRRREKKKPKKDAQKAVPPPTTIISPPPMVEVIKKGKKRPEEEEEAYLRALDRRIRRIQYERTLKALQQQERKPWSPPTVSEILGLLDAEIADYIKDYDEQRRRIQAEKDRAVAEARAHQVAMQRLRERIMVERDATRREDMIDEARKRERQLKEAEDERKQLEAEGRVEIWKRTQFRGLDLWYDEERAKIQPIQDPNARQNAVDELAKQFEDKRNEIMKEYESRLQTVQDEAKKAEEKVRLAEAKAKDVEAELIEEREATKKRLEEAREKAVADFQKTVGEESYRGFGAPPSETESPYETEQYQRAMGRYAQEHLATGDTSRGTPTVQELLDGGYLPHIPYWRHFAKEEREQTVK